MPELMCVVFIKAHSGFGHEENSRVIDNKTEVYKHVEESGGRGYII